MQIDKYRNEINIKDDGDKNKNVKSKNKVKNKDRDNIKKSSSYKGKIIVNNNKKKDKDRAANIKYCDKVEDRNRNNINIELNKNDIYEKILNRSRTSNKNMGS